MLNFLLSYYQLFIYKYWLYTPILVPKMPTKLFLRLDSWDSLLLGLQSVYPVYSA